MRKLLFRVAILVGVAYAVRTLLQDEGRRQSLAHVPANMMEKCMEMMPEDSPPKAMMSALARIQEQNDETAMLLRQQNELLRQRAAGPEPAAAE